MKFATKSGNQYWYEPVTNVIEEYVGQTDERLPYVQFCDVPQIESLPDLEHYILEITRECNLRCSYCCYSGQYRNHRIHEQVAMDENMIDKVFSFIEKTRNIKRQLTISFYGGEPLIKKGILRYAIERGREIFPDDTIYTVSTNGILIDDPILEWMIANDLHIHVSLDGTQRLHDKNRRNIANKATFSIVMRNLTSIYYKNNLFWKNNVRLFVTLESLRYLCSIAKYWGTHPILKTKEPTSISSVAANYDVVDSTENDVDAYKVLNRLMKYYCNNRDNKFAQTFFEQFTSTVTERTYGTLPNNLQPIVCLPHNLRCFIDATGEIGICEKTCDTLRYGTITKGFDYDKINTIVQEHAKAKRCRCANCWALRLCKTCFTNYNYSDLAWEKDCELQRETVRLQLRITCEMAENRLLKSVDAEQTTLRELNATDVEALYQLMRKSSIVKYIRGISPFKTRRKARLFYEILTKGEYEDEQPPIMRCIVNANNVLIGLVGFDYILGPSANLFFVLDKPYWGKGIMTYALSEFLAEHAKSDMKVHVHISESNKRAFRLINRFSSLYLHCDVENN